MTDIRFRFGEINADDQLTPEDKKRIKEFFLQNMIAPKARRVLEQIIRVLRKSERRAARGIDSRKQKQLAS